jgi:hypothetical protein
LIVQFSFHCEYVPHGILIFSSANVIVESVSHDFDSSVQYCEYSSEATSFIQCLTLYVVPLCGSEIAFKVTGQVIIKLYELCVLTFVEPLSHLAKLYQTSGVAETVTSDPQSYVSAHETVAICSSFCNVTVNLLIVQLNISCTSLSGIINVFGLAV